MDLESKTVRTVAGTEEQSRRRSGGLPAKTTSLNSPWDILPDPKNPDPDLHCDGRAAPDLSAGPGKAEVRVWAGSGIENIVNGTTRTSAAFAQPSGLVTDDRYLFAADSEVSDIRAVSLTRDQVTTIMGVDLFGFGDWDGRGEQVRLQHCLGLAHGPGGLYVADTYNNKIKLCAPGNRTVHTFVGSHQAGSGDDPPQFDEPGGLSLAGDTLYVADTNNHAIRAVDLTTKKVRTLALEGVTKPNLPRRPPSFPNATEISAPAVQVSPGARFTLDVTLTPPAGFKLNPGTPIPYRLQAPGNAAALADSVRSAGATVDPPATHFQVEIPLARPAEARLKLMVTLSVSAFLCKASLCEIHSYVWTVPVTFSEGGTDHVPLTTRGK